MAAFYGFAALKSRFGPPGPGLMRGQADTRHATKFDGSARTVMTATTSPRATPAITAAEVGGTIAAPADPVRSSVA
jgi:hypothetical protein